MVGKVCVCVREHVVFIITACLNALCPAASGCVLCHGADPWSPSAVTDTFVPPRNPALTSP